MVAGIGRDGGRLYLARRVPTSIIGVDHVSALASETVLVLFTHTGKLKKTQSRQESLGHKGEKVEASLLSLPTLPNSYP